MDRRPVQFLEKIGGQHVRFVFEQNLFQIFLVLVPRPTLAEDAVLDVDGDFVGVGDGVK